jgi:putative flippase GtrA
VIRGPLLGQVVRFLGVGGVAFVVDVGLFNALIATGVHPILAKTASSGLAIAVAYVGNRSLTFRSAPRSGVFRQAALFLAVNLVAAGVAVACLWVSQHVLGLTGALADNVAANGVGVALGMVLRFVLYRIVVFRVPRVGTAV